MNAIMSSLGLDAVEADPNAIPDGRYNGEVFKSEYVYNPKNKTVAHVITYRVIDGSHKGATVTDWNSLGKDPVFAEGHDGEIAHVVSMTNTQDEQNKRYYKKTFVDLGIAEQDVPNTSVEELVGKKVIFGVKKNGNYRNITFVEIRDGAPATSQAVTQPGQTSGGVAGLL